MSVALFGTMRRPKRWYNVFRAFAPQFVDSFSKNEPLDLAAQLAYYAILSLFPFVMFLLTVVGYIPLSGLGDRITQAIYQMMPQGAADLVNHTMHEIIGQQRGWLLLATLFFALWSASGGTSGLITALNRAYEVTESRAWWRVKLRSLLVTIGAAAAIIVATLAMLIGPGIVQRIWAFFGVGGWFDFIWAIVRVPLAVLVLMLMLACIYYFLPNVKQKWRFITPGSVVAVLAWLLASWGFRTYVTHFDSYAKSYGALGTVIVLLVWLYISGLMVILGGEVNAILDRVIKGMQHTEEEPVPQDERRSSPQEERRPGSQEERRPGSPPRKPRPA